MMIRGINNNKKKTEEIGQKMKNSNVERSSAQKHVLTATLVVIVLKWHV